MIQNMVNPMTLEPFIIKKIIHENKDTFTLELLSENHKKFEFEAGQFNMLYVFGVGEVPISISGDPKKSDKLIHTIRNVGTVTNVMSKLKKNDVIGVRGPYGTSWPVEKAKGKNVFIFAGGLGLAPLRPAIYQILSNLHLYKKVTIFYGAKDPENMIFEKELETWKNHFDVDLQMTVDHDLGIWKGNVGVITSLIEKINFNPDDSIAMVCGPEIMMYFSAVLLENKGLSPENIYISMERNMKCAIGLCGHCQFGADFICKDGAVFPYNKMKNLITKREV